MKINFIKIFGLEKLEEEEKLKRTILLRIILLTSFFGIIWGVFYIFFMDLFVPGLCPIIYALLSFINVFLFYIFNQYNFFRITQLILILFLPFFTQISLGSFINGSGVILASLLSPMGALMFYSVKVARRLLYAFIGLVALAGAHELFFSVQQNKLAEDIIVVFFILNIVVISSIAYVLLEHYVAKESDLKKLLIQKNKDIIDSITYAKKIQQAILPSDKQVALLLPESFVLYKPKDIVSGDFYWATQWGNKILFAAVDCTGHGVPGAFMSIVAQNLLNQAINEYGLTKPNLILNALNKGISRTLNQNKETAEIKDGMDISLCCWDIKEMTLEFAGAYNPLWILRNNEIKEIEGDKFPVGSFIDDRPQNFKNNEIKLQKGDVIYIFTDGYADQFGGPKGKKFKQKQVKEVLLDIQNLPLFRQREILDKRIEEWKGVTEEQIDDILFIGVKV